jgi:uncharacterized protein YtpQ (UPF0354 family)
MALDRLDGVLPVLEAPAARVPNSPGGGAPIHRPFVGQLVTAYVVEEGDLTRTLERRELAAARMDEKELHARALENLAKHVETIGIRLRPYGSIMAVLFDGDLEATLMLYEPLWSHLCEEFADELVVAVPARDVLVASPADSPAGLAELGAVVARVWPRDDHPLTSELFRIGTEPWGVWSSPAV